MIAEIIHAGKGLIPKLMVPAIIVLVCLASFGLGRLSALKEGERGLVITMPPEVAEENR